MLWKPLATSLFLPLKFSSAPTSIPMREMTKRMGFASMAVFRAIWLVVALAAAGTNCATRPMAIWLRFPNTPERALPSWFRAPMATA